MKPILYNATETLFDSYGMGEIDANKATATREKNGNYSLYIEYPVGGSLTPLFKQDMRIKADAGVRTKNQTFYISRIVKDSSHVIKIYAKHISHLTETMGIVHGTIAVGDANAALSRWSESLVGGVEFRTWSDIETEGKTSWTVDKFKTAREALGGIEGSILDVWGGEYEFDNTTIRLHKQLGRKTPTVLQYGRNILSAEEDENSESSYTSIYPYASYTPEADEGGRQADPVFVTLPEKIVDSQWVKMYADRRVQVVDFSSKFAEKETPTLDKLRKMAERYVHDNRIGIPKTSIKVEYVDLAKTLDYADMAFMEEVELCDIVPIFYPKIGLTNEDGKVVVVNYDVLNDRNESIEIGTIGQGMKSAMVGSLGERLEALENRQTRLESNIPAYLLDGKGNKVWYQTPDNTREHKVGDTWFEKNGLYDRIYVWNGEIWEKRIDTEDVDVIAKEIDNKFKGFKSSTKLIEQKAEEALQNAGASSLLAQEAKRIGLDSIAKLEEFKRQATSAQTTLSGDLDVLKKTLANDILPKQAQVETEISKQVEALIQTKNELAGVKSAQATYEETTMRRLSELTNLANGKASKSELLQTAEELASKIASVKVGGRNYYRDSEKIRTSTRFFPFPIHPYLSRENIGETWTLSFDIKFNEGGEIRPLHFYHYQTNRFGLKASADITPSKEWQRFTFTGPVIFPNDDPRYSRGEMALYDYGGNNSYSVRRIKFEKGTLATDWSPAIEDIEGQLSTVESNFRQRADSLDAGVRSLTEGLRTKADISALNVTAENIRQSVKSLETDTQNKLDQKLNQAEFEVRAGSIRQEILNATKDKADKTLVVAEAGKLREEFSNLRVGGRNYYRDSEKVRTSTRFFSFPIHLYLTQENVGEIWTLSFDLKINEGGEIRPLHFYHYQTNRFGLKASADITPSKEWQRFTFTGPIVFPNDDLRYSRGEMALYDYGGNNNYSVRRIKLEKGTLATDWSSAIEDTEGIITEAKATFERTAQGLRTDLSAIQEYVNKDGQRQEALQRYTREESAKQATAVRELVTKDYVGKATYQETVRAIENKFEAITNPQNGSIATQIANYKAAVDGRFADISSLLSGKASQADFQRVKETSQLYERILGNTENGIADKVARMAMTNRLFQVEVSKNEGLKTVQRQLAGSWAVQNINSAGDIISGINLGANGHNRFDGKLTHITGETLIDKAVIKSAMIGEAQINTAHIDSIDAANGRIINLSANNFTANRVEGLKLIGGDLSATNGAMKIDLNKGQYEVYTEEAAMRRVVAGFPNQFIKFATGKQEVEHEEGVKSGVTIIGSNSDGTENGNNQTFAGIQIWNNAHQRNVNSIGDYLRVSNKGFGENEKGWIIQTSDTPTIGPIVDNNKPETGKRSAILSGDFYFINKWGQKVSLLGILERFIVNFNTLRDKRGILYTDFSELN
ncbi:phage tail protein [Streptococcus sp. 27098_8_69]